MGAVRIALPALLLVTSCAPAAKPVASPATPTGDVGSTGVEQPPAALEVSGWREWKKSNPRRFRSKGHGYLWVDVHVHASHAEMYGDRSKPTPVGFAVAMAGYETADATEPTGLTVMAKMPPGYDPENGDWYYAIFDAAGKSATLGGKLAPCTGCHIHARPRDFLFGVAAKEEAP